MMKALTRTNPYGRNSAWRHFSGHFACAVAFRATRKVGVYDSLPEHSAAVRQRLVGRVKNILEHAWGVRAPLVFQDMRCPRQHGADCGFHAVNNALRAIGLESNHDRQTLREHVLHYDQYM